MPWRKIKQILISFWRTVRPLLLLPFLLQGNILVERMIASTIGLDVVSALDYAKFISETIIVLLSVPIALVGLSRWSEISDKNQLRNRLEVVVKIMSLLCIPLSMFLIVNSSLVIKVIYEYGAFTADSTVVTQSILFGISFGLWAQAIGYILIKALNSQLQNKMVLIIMGIALLSNALFNIIFFPTLGAMALGLGNAAYGLLLLIGGVIMLKIWRATVGHFILLLLGALLYYAVSWSIPEFGSGWTELMLAFLYSIIYWSAWVYIFPTLRNSIAIIKWR